jgi:hypothetical protein
MTFEISQGFDTPRSLLKILEQVPDYMLDVPFAFVYESDDGITILKERSDGGDCEAPDVGAREATLDGIDTINGGNHEIGMRITFVGKSASN